MYLELNLVKIDSIYAMGGSILARSRSLVKTDIEVISEIIKFIGENITIFDAALTDKNLVAKLENIRTISIDEFQCLRYTLAEKGLDIRYWAVADVESNEDQIPDNSLEYNIVDGSNYSSNFVPFCSKLTVNPDEGSIAAVYEKIANMYGMFESDLFKGRVNTFMKDIEVMKAQEQAVGFVPAPIAQHINTILEFCNKSVYVIGN